VSVLTTAKLGVQGIHGIQHGCLALIVTAVALHNLLYKQLLEVVVVVAPSMVHTTLTLQMLVLVVPHTIVLHHGQVLAQEIVLLEMLTALLLLL